MQSGGRGGLVVAGDPLQIEPTIRAPGEIVRSLREYAGLEEHQLGLGASVQTLADRANPVGTYVELDGQRQWGGIPLRIR